MPTHPQPKLRRSPVQIFLPFRFPNFPVPKLRVQQRTLAASDVKKSSKSIFLLLKRPPKSSLRPVPSQRPKNTRQTAPQRVTFDVPGMALENHDAKIKQVADMVLRAQKTKPPHLEDYLRFQALDATHAEMIH
ncbi:hypothetical protein PG984_014131 [Apiospora sp. TS-2023a]